MEVTLGDTARKVLESVFEGKTVATISRELNVSRPTVAFHLRSLVKYGYIKHRERICTYEVTENGKKILD